MSKKLVLVLASFFLIGLINKSSAQQIQKVNDSTIVVHDGAIVPSYSTFFLKSTTGKTIATFRAGQKVKLKKPNTTIAAMDCVVIDCPGGFGAGVTCWKCKERPQ